MSLINDALKQKNVSKGGPVGDRSVPNPMQPVMDSPTGSRILPMALVVLGVGALAGGVMFWFKGRPAVMANKTSSSSPAKPVSANLPKTVGTKATPAQNPLQRAAATLGQVQQRNEEGSAAAAAIAGTTSTPEASRNIASSPASAVSRPVTASVAANPELKLQAIYFRAKGPTALINNKTVMVGQVVDGAKLLSINRNAVEVELNGTKRTLTLK
jgi:hypothetical protein